MMVECETGLEERSMTGSIGVTKAKSPAQPGAESAAAANTGSSYFNKQEAILAVRYASPPKAVAKPLEFYLVSFTGISCFDNGGTSLVSFFGSHPFCKAQHC